MSFKKSEVKAEHSGKRDLFYNLWHRTLGKGYWMVDLDCVESRYGRGIIAIMGRSLYTGKFPIDKILEYKSHELQVLNELGKRANVPVYFVFYHMNKEVVKALKQICQDRQNRFESFNVDFIKSLKLDEVIYQFDVYKIGNDEINFFKSMSNEQYANFIKNL